ncbi:MAG TPA: hypothetical protein VNO23_06915 [Candidatus Binatia bacterium]|nr:hypothetical protein [Candidatus Binatia bacterium]
MIFRPAVALAVLLLPALAGGQPPRSDVDLETRIRRPRTVVRPPTDAGQVARDAEEVSPPPAALPAPAVAPGRRPDLGDDVREGIQQRHLLDALRRR